MNKKYSKHNSSMNDNFKEIERFQKKEITGHVLYRYLAGREKNTKNKQILNKIAKDELRHYNMWKKYTGKDVHYDFLEIIKYKIIANTLGITFAIKFMEKGEVLDQSIYAKVAKRLPEAIKILADEEMHENELISLLNEKKLKYVGSVVLGLNDALVELTGALAGMSFALQNMKIVALAGLITGIAAALSMAASEYLSQKADGNQNALEASAYTGTAYIITVALLVAPFFIFEQLAHAIFSMLCTGVIVIAVFTYFISVIKGLSFKSKFIEMASISLGVALISFAIGALLKMLIGDAGV